MLPMVAYSNQYIKYHPWIYVVVWNITVNDYNLPTEKEEKVI